MHNNTPNSMENHRNQHPQIIFWPRPWLINIYAPLPYCSRRELMVYRTQSLFTQIPRLMALCKADIIREVMETVYRGIWFRNSLLRSGSCGSDTSFEHSLLNRLNPCHAMLFAPCSSGKSEIQTRGSLIQPSIAPCDVPTYPGPVLCTDTFMH